MSQLERSIAYKQPDPVPVLISGSTMRGREERGIRIFVGTVPEKYCSITSYYKSMCVCVFIYWFLLFSTTIYRGYFRLIECIAGGPRMYIVEFEVVLMSGFVY